MDSLLQEFLATGVFAFMLVFVRIGTVIMLLPGIGDMFTPGKVRLAIALGLSLILMPFTSQFMPSPIPPAAQMIMLLGAEFIVGILIGTMARILMAALDVAGMVISLSTGLGNAQLFIPTMASQGSLVGAVLTMTGVVMIFVTNMHHFIIAGLVNSYHTFPVGLLPAPEGMAMIVSKAVAVTFTTGIQIAAPFILIGMMIYIIMGILARLMPQVQVFLLVLPLQIILGFTTLFLGIGVMMMLWISRFEDGMTYIFLGGN